MSFAQRGLAIDYVESPISDRSSLPLLSSVQIFFCSFCSASGDVSRLVQRAVSVNCPAPTGICPLSLFNALYLFGLCYLCCLLFKFSSVPSVENASTTRRESKS